MDALEWMKSKAQALFANGVLDASASAASTNLDRSIEDLRVGLLLTKTMLEAAGRKQLGCDIENLLEQMRESAHNAGDLLEELDCFLRIQDDGTNNSHVLKHTTPASLPGKIQDAKQRPVLNAVHLSQRIKDTIQKMHRMRDACTHILPSLETKTANDIAHNCPITKGQIDETAHLLDSIIHDVAKVRAPFANGSALETWNATNNLGPNIEALKMELLLVMAMLETAFHKQIGPAMEDLLRKLQGLAHNAGNLLDELDCFRIHNELHGTSNDLAFYDHHTAKALGKLACWSASNPHEPGKVQDARQHKVFNKFHVSIRMKHIVKQLKLVRTEFTKILWICDCKTAQDTAQSRPITVDQNVEPRSCGRYDLVDTIHMTKVLAHFADGLLEAWATTNNFGLNMEALKTELLLASATIETANRKQISGLAIAELLDKLLDLADSANDLLSELYYFRIHDQQRPYNHGEGAVHNLLLKAVGKSKCLPGGWTPKLGKLLPYSCSPYGHDDNSGQSTLCGVPQRVHAGGAPVLRFNSVRVSERMKRIVEQLQPMRIEVTKILENCGLRVFRDIAQFRPATTAQTTEPKLYGRDHIMNTIIHDMTKGEYCDKRLTVLPVVGPGGIGKTTLIQHIYCNKHVQKHFPIMIWICVSLSFNPRKVLEEIKESIPEVEGEGESRLEELIKQRLKSKRFLLVLDDIWGFRDADDWKRLLLPLNTSEVNGSMVLVTTRFPSMTWKVGTTHRSIELQGLETEEFRKLFFTSVFGNEQCGRDHSLLLETGDKIMGKLKGSPLAVKTVGTLLRNDLNLCHWKKVLEIKQWERQTGINDIMPTLRLSYDHLPYHHQQCFSYSALFPEDFHFSSSQLINLWIGLDILQLHSPNQTLEEMGLNTLNDLVAYGFFREEETNGRPCYVMHGLLHDLALNVASHECLTLHLSNAGSVDIHPTIRHLSVIIDDDNAVSGEHIKAELRKLNTRLKVEHLQTLMLFGEMDESFVNIFGDLFREANALRVLHLPQVSYPVESILHNFSTLVHLRYICLGTKVTGLMHRYSVSVKHLKNVQVLDLDDCKNVDNSTMVDICLMIKLKYLSLKQTQVTKIPPEISNLQNLETLDIRQTQVKELPREVLQLRKLNHLHFGQSGCFGVKLPVGIGQMESVQVMGTVDSRECSKCAMNVFNELTALRELEVVLYDGPDDMEQNDKLLSSAAKCSLLKSLTIYGDSKPCNELPPESSNFPQLEMLKVAGRLVKVPGWIAQLSTLTTLVIRVCNLEENTLMIVGGLPCLRVLALALVAVPRKQVTITSSTGFARLEVFSFDCRVPWVRFREKAMPNLKKLQLQLYSEPRARDKFPSGIMLLERLNMVFLLYSSKYAASDSVFEVVAVVRENAASHANLIELSINGDTETFPSNISADRCVAGTEFVNAGGEIEEV